MCRAAVGFGNRAWGNETVMTYLKTGVFNYSVPTGRPVHWEVGSPGRWTFSICLQQPVCGLAAGRSQIYCTLQDPNGKPGCDFMGVNHYAR